MKLGNRYLYQFFYFIFLNRDKCLFGILLSVEMINHGLMKCKHVDVFKRDKNL